MAAEDVIPFRDLPPRDAPGRDGRRREPAARRADDPSAGPSLREQLQRLGRRRGVIAATLLSVVLLTFLVVQQITPTYTATVTLMIQSQGERTLPMEAVVAGLTTDLETIQGELAVVTSRGIAERTIDRMGLDKLAEFNPDVAEAEGRNSGVISGLSRAVASAIDGFLGLFGLSRAPEDRAADLRTRIVNNFLKQVEAVPQGRSRVIRIHVTSEDRRRAADIANTLADVYILDQLEAKYDAIQKATRWLNERLADLRGRTEAAERKVEEFRSRTGLVQGETTTLAAQELSRLNAEMVLLRSRTAEAEARFRAAADARGVVDARSLPMAVLQSPLIQTLQAQQIELNRRIADLRETFGDKHPTIVNARAELADLGKRIAGEVDRVVSGLRNEVTVAREREAVLERELERLKSAAGERGGSVVELKSLEEEANANRLLLNTLMQRANETDLQTDLQVPDARVISPAAVPQLPSQPNNPVILGAAVFLGGVLGVLLALLIENFDRGFRSAAQIAEATGVASLGLIPKPDRKSSPRTAIEDLALLKPRSAYGEAVASLLTSLMMIHGDRPPRTVLIASAVPDEGKTTVALTLARAAASGGLRTLLIDADLRRPAVHGLLSLALQPGLAELLQQSVALEEVLHRDPKSPLDVIPAGGHIANPLHLLAADRTRATLHGLGKQYDLIVIDSPPVLVVSDARILSRYADTTVFAVRWASTRREHVLHAIDRIVEAGGEIGGTLLTRVDVKRHATYDFADSGQYNLGPRYYEG